MSPRTLVLGSRGPFTRAALSGLLEGGVRVTGLVVASGVPGAEPRRLDPRPDLTRSGSDPFELARSRRISVHSVGSLAAAAAAGLLAELDPELIAVACFPRLLPRAWRERPALGAVNLHPSLLPAYRGPVPLFWQLHGDEPRTGVTVHRVDAGIDTGPILAQRRVALREGASTDEVERQLAGEGACLLAEALAGEALSARPQGERGASRQGWPGDPERRISLDWSARRAFNLIRGAARWGPFVVAGERVGAASGWWPEDAAPEARPGERRVRLRSGVLGFVPESALGGGP